MLLRAFGSSLRLYAGLAGLAVVFITGSVAPAAAQGQPAIVTAFLDELDEDKRIVFVLADVEGMPVPEIAELVGIKLNTAYSRLRAARQQFRTAISRHHGGGR